MKISYNNSPRKNLIGEKVRILRKSAGTSQRDMAVKLQTYGYDFTALTILRIEKGTRLVTDIELKILCDYFKIRPDQMLEYPNDVPANNDSNIR